MVSQQRLQQAGEGSGGSGGAAVVSASMTPAGSGLAVESAWMVHWEDLAILRPIGEGSFGKVGLPTRQSPLPPPARFLSLVVCW